MASVSDPVSFPGNWKQLVLDNEELFQALLDNDVAGLVRNTLQSSYGNLEVFHNVVADCVKSTMLCVVNMVRKRVVEDLYLLFRWDTDLANQLDRRKHKTDNSGDRNGMSILTKEQVHEIRRRYVQTGRRTNRRELAAEFGVLATTITSIVKRKTWNNI